MDAESGGKTHSIVLRLQRVTREDAYVAVGDFAS